jgi:hypothetical protein
VGVDSAGISQFRFARYIARSKMDAVTSVIAIVKASWDVMQYIHDVHDGGKMREELVK